MSEIVTRCKNVIAKDRENEIYLLLESIPLPMFSCAKCDYGGGEQNRVACNSEYAHCAKQWTEYIRDYNALRKKISLLDPSKHSQAILYLHDFVKKHPPITHICPDYQISPSQNK